jgi:cell division protease FtsH
MDGFDTQDGILVIAATNSYNSLDPALIRPGRFDLRYNISNPDFSTRIKLIDLYTKKKNLAEDVDKEKLAESFETLSCSGIETLLNEAAMEAMLEKRDTISIDNIINSAKKTNCSINLRKLKR